VERYSDLCADVQRGGSLAGLPLTCGLNQAFLGMIHRGRIPDIVYKQTIMHIFDFAVPAAAGNNLLLQYRRGFDSMETKGRLSDMPLRTLIGLPVILAIILAAASASAQVYKWVDERGVTNYSNQPPAGKAAKNVGLVEDRISVYSSDKTVTASTDAPRQKSDQALADKISSLERQLEEERWARQYASAAAAQSAYDPCLGNINCNGLYDGYYSAPTFVFAPVRHRPRRIVQPQLAPGTIAGNAVGMNGFIPGNSAAFASSVSLSRSTHEASARFERVRP
jgi:hypothetical protein